MKIIVNKVGVNSLTVQRNGFAPKAMGYRDFFEIEMFEPNEYSFVDSVELINNIIRFNKVEAEYNLQYTDDYILAEELLKDEEFVKQLGLFLESYNSKKEELNRTLDERLNKNSVYDIEYTAVRAGQDLYREYTETGIVPPICRDEIAIRILNNCQNNPKKITTCRSDDPYYGTSITNTVTYQENEKYETAAKVCAGVSLVSFIGSIVLLPAGVTTTLIPFTLTGITVYGAHKFNKTWSIKQKEKDSENIAIILDELKQRYSYFEPINKTKTK